MKDKTIQRVKSQTDLQKQEPSVIPTAQLADIRVVVWRITREEYNKEFNIKESQ